MLSSFGAGCWISTFKYYYNKQDNSLFHFDSGAESFVYTCICFNITSGYVGPSVFFLTSCWCGCEIRSGNG